MTIRTPAVVALLLAASLQAAPQPAAAPPSLPAAVRTAFERAYPRAVLDRWMAERKDGKPVFEVESHEGAQKRDLLYSETGQLIESEEAIPVTALPAAVRQAVAKAYPQATIHGAERIVRGEVTEYELALEGAAVTEVVVGVDGVIQKGL